MMSNSSKVLIVDDDPGPRKALKVRLSHQGYEVHEAPNGTEALAKIAADKPDVILLDLGLPDMDGLEVLQQLKGDEELCTIPVIIVSGRTQSDIIIKGLDLGAADYVTKPYHMPELWARLRAAGRAKRDYDTIEEVNQRLYETRRQAEEATRSKSEFLANMSHEIRTPLTAILGYAELAYQAASDYPEIHKDIDVVRTNGKYLLDLINDILDLAKIEAGKLDIEQIDCSVVEIVSQVTAIMRVRAIEKGIALQSSYERKIPRTIRSDPTRIRQALINLVSNAIKFTPSGSVMLEVQLIDTDTEPMIEFKVIDTGIGIESDRLQTIFEPFSQADGGTTRVYGGTGLGLSITKRIVEALKGRISVESIMGAGTVFCFSVPTGPLDGVEMVDDPEAESVRLKSSDDREAQEDIYFAGKVLLAEDTPVNQKLIQRMLQKVGLEVDVVDNGKLACEAVQCKEYDVVLMDLHMPIMDGMEAARTIRKSRPGIPIFALTADAMRESRERCLHQGFNGYLTKPIIRDEMFRELSQCLQRVDKADTSPTQEAQSKQQSSTVEPDNSDGLKVINPESAMQRIQMDLESYLEVLSEYTPWLKKQQEALNSAINSDDLEAISFAAHAIKSASGTVGIERVHRAAHRLDLTAKGKQEGDIKQLFDDLNIRVSEAMDCINEYFTQHEADSRQEAPDSNEPENRPIGDLSRELEQLKSQLSQVMQRVDALICRSASAVK